MSYCVTGMFATPDVGFKAESCVTARGAKALADRFRAEGRLHVEICDDRGEIVDRDRLDRAIAENGACEDDVNRRLRPWTGAPNSPWRSAGNLAPRHDTADARFFDSST